MRLVALVVTMFEELEFTACMWPNSPDGFEPWVHAPLEVDHDAAHFFAFRGKSLITVQDADPPGPLTRDQACWLEGGEYIYLGDLEGRACFAFDVTSESLTGYGEHGLLSLLGRMEPRLFYLAGRAFQLIEWQRNHAYCGKCGQPTFHHERDRALVCRGCGHSAYPRLSPSIIVLVWREQEMLLARNAAWPNGFFSTLAGFVEPGESIEQTVHREVEEEVALKVTNLRYLGSQSWPFPNSLMLGFQAEYLSGEIRCQEAEIAEAHWYRFDQPPSIPPAWAISRWLIDDFVHRCRNGSSRRSSG